MVYELLIDVQDNLASLRSQITDVSTGQDALRGAVDNIQQELGILSHSSEVKDDDEEETIGMFGISKPPGRKGKNPEDRKPPRPRSRSPLRETSEYRVAKPKFKKPANYDGKSKGKAARQWLTKVMVYVAAHKEGFKDENEVMLFMLTMMDDTAADWAQPLIEAIAGEKKGAPKDFDEITTLFAEAFDDPDAGRAAERKITTLIQTGNTTDYTTEFRILAADLAWNDSALRAQYRRGLHWKLKEQLSFLENPPKTLHSLISKAIELDNVRRENEANRPPKPPKSNKPSSSGTTNKATASTTTTTKTTLKDSGNYVDNDEKERRRKAGVCVKCGKAGHSFEECRTGWKGPKKEEKKEEKKEKKVSGAAAKIESDEDLTEEESENE